MKVQFTLNIGYGKGPTDIFEFNEDITDKELDELYKDWQNNFLDGGWYKLEE